MSCKEEFSIFFKSDYLSGRWSIEKKDLAREHYAYYFAQSMYTAESRGLLGHK